MVLATSPAFADEFVAERVIAAYGALESYCDTIAVQDRSTSEMQRCFTRDGRYKRVEQVESRPPITRRTWGDSELEYTWFSNTERTTLYLERPARTWRTGGLPEGLPARALSPFLRSGDSERQVHAALREMEVVEVGPEATILQRLGRINGDSPRVTRIWVRNADNLVVRGEETWSDRTLWSVTLVEARVNPQLAAADLTETAPYWNRVKLKMGPAILVGGVVVLLCFLGFVLWFAGRKLGRMKHWPRTVTVSAVLIVAGYYLFTGMRGGAGVVLNATTDEPIPGATVTLDCQRAQFHGSRTIKVVTRIADEHGRFHFASTEVWRCNSAYVRASKDGYIRTSSLDVRYAHTAYDRIPARIHLTPADEERLQRMRFHAAMSRGVTVDPVRQYQIIYRGFMDSLEIAATPVEHAFVRDTFCERLLDIHATLSEPQRVDLATRRYRPQPTDHDAHVAPYCAEAGDGI